MKKGKAYKGFDYVKQEAIALTLDEWRQLAHEYKAKSRQVEHNETTYKDHRGVLLLEVYTTVPGAI